MGCVKTVIKVIGIGNRLMTDDGIAIAIMGNLKSRLESMGLEVIIGETDFQYCFHHIKEDDFVIILDAICLNSAAGSIYSCSLHKALDSYGETGSQHAMSIFDLMRLYAIPVKGCFIGINAAEIGFGCELSGTLKCNFNRICLEVERLICRIMEEEQHTQYIIM